MFFFFFFFGAFVFLASVRSVSTEKLHKTSGASYSKGAKRSGSSARRNLAAGVRLVELNKKSLIALISRSYDNFTV